MTQQQTTDPKTLMEELGLSDLPKAKQEELAIRMTEVVLKRIFLEAVEKLNEPDQEAFAKMIEKKSTPEEIEKFLKDKISNYGAMVEKIVADFKEEMKKGLIV